MPTPQSSQELLLAQADYLHFVSKQNSQNTQLGRIALPTHNNNQEDFEEFEDEIYPQNNHSQQNFHNKASLSKNNLTKRKHNEIIGLDDFKSIYIETLDFENTSAEYYEIFSNPEKGFRLMLYGVSGHGKSTFAVDFAGFLSETYGKTLFCSSEEGISITLQDKLRHIKNKNLFVTACETGQELIKLLKKNTDFNFIFIDSINDMEISVPEFKQIRALNPKMAIIYIMQCNKDGSFKGDSKFKHQCDISTKVEHYEPIVEKTRYNKRK